MQKYIILFFSVLVFFAACSKDGPPANVINQPEMTRLLTDVHLIDGQLYAINQQSDSLYKYGTAKYKKIFQQYHTTDAAFKKSLKYYSTRPELIQEMYDTIQRKIQFKIDSLNKAGTKNNKHAIPAK